MNPLVFKMWRNSIFWGIVLYLLVVTYVWRYTDTFSLEVLSNAAAGTGGILIGTSFALSGLSYFFNIFDSKLQYRKYLGLLGYYFALAYAISLLFRFPDRYITHFSATIFETQALLGITAMIILTCMMCISHQYWMKLLGKHWRPLLRVGYLAYGLLVVRAALLEHAMWRAWLLEPDGLPPMRLLLSTFAVCVIALRLVMEVKMLLSPHPAITPAASTSN